MFRKLSGTKFLGIFNFCFLKQNFQNICNVVWNEFFVIKVLEHMNEMYFSSRKRFCEQLFFLPSKIQFCFSDHS